MLDSALTEGSVSGKAGHREALAGKSVLRFDLVHRKMTFHPADESAGPCRAQNWAPLRGDPGAERA
jgi:hypothetical protein